MKWIIFTLLILSSYFVHAQNDRLKIKTDEPPKHGDTIVTVFITSPLNDTAYFYFNSVLKKVVGTFDTTDGATSAILSTGFSIVPDALQNNVLRIEFPETGLTLRSKILAGYEFIYFYKEQNYYCLEYSNTWEVGE